MVDPRVRKERLVRDYEAIQKIRCPQIDFDPFVPPAPERYEIRFRLRSIAEVRGNSPVYTTDGHIHRVEIKLPASYPERLTDSDVRFLSTRIFHPNVYTDGRICIRDFRPAESLARFVLRLARYIQCDPAYTGLDSPANSDAQRFFLGHEELFPVDRNALPELDQTIKKRFSVGNRGEYGSLPGRFVVAPKPGSGVPGGRRFHVAVKTRQVESGGGS